MKQDPVSDGQTIIRLGAALSPSMSLPSAFLLSSSSWRALNTACAQKSIGSGHSVWQHMWVSDTISHPLKRIVQPAHRASTHSRKGSPRDVVGAHLELRPGDSLRPADKRLADGSLKNPTNSELHALKRLTLLSCAIACHKSAVFGILACQRG